MIHRFNVRSKLSRTQIFGIFAINLIASLTIVKPYFEDLAKETRLKKQIESSTELIEKK